MTWKDGVSPWLQLLTLPAAFPDLGLYSEDEAGRRFEVLPPLGVVDSNCRIPWRRIPR